MPSFADIKQFITRPGGQQQPGPSSPPPPQQGGGPAYGDYFKYANGGNTPYGASIAGTPLDQSGWTGGGGEGGGTGQASQWQAPNLQDQGQSGVPDRYKGLLSYNEQGSAAGPSAYSGYQLNPNVIKNLPKTKFGSVDNVQNLGKDGGAGPGQTLKNPNLKYYDPNYGWVTPKSNLTMKENRLQAASPDILQGIAGLAFGQLPGLGLMGHLAQSGIGGAASIGNGGDWKNVALGMAPGLVGAGLGASGFQMPAGVSQMMKYAGMAGKGYGLYNMLRRG